MANSTIKNYMSDWKETDSVEVSANSLKWVADFTKPVIVTTTNLYCIPYVGYINGMIKGFVYNTQNTAQTATIRYKEINK